MLSSKASSNLCTSITIKYFAASSLFSYICMALSPVQFKSPVLVPFWVKLRLEQLGLSIQEALNPQVMATHFNLEDAAHMLLLNTDHTKQVFGVARPDPVVRMHWVKDGQYLQRIERVLSIHAPTLVERLFSVDAKQGLFAKPYSIDDPCREYTFVTIYPGHFGDPLANSHQCKLRQDILRIAYSSSTYDQVAKDVLYAAYFKEVTA